MSFIGSVFSGLSIDSPIWLLLLLGLGVGVLSGLLGVGGGVLMTPALHVLGMPMPMAVGTSLTQMVASSLTGTFKHFRLNQIIPSITVLLGLPALVGVWLGRELMVYWSHDQKADGITSAIYMTILAIIGSMMLRKSLQKGNLEDQARATAPEQHHFSKANLWNIGPKIKLLGEQRFPVIAPSLLGMTVGLISGLTGLGGGFFYVPVMITYMNINIRKAVGTSLACVLLGSIVGAFSFAKVGLSDLKVAFILAVGSSFGGLIGASATQYVKGRSIHVLFSFLVWIAALSMLLRRLMFLNASYVMLFGSSLIVVLFAVANATYHALKQHQKLV